MLSPSGSAQVIDLCSHIERRRNNAASQTEPSCFKAAARRLLLEALEQIGGSADKKNNALFVRIGHSEISD